MVRRYSATYDSEQADDILTVALPGPSGELLVDPVVIFKMLLIGYLYGITSERRLAQEVSLHLAYRWFLGYDFDVSTPDHSVLASSPRRAPGWAAKCSRSSSASRLSSAGRLAF